MIVFHSITHSFNADVQFTYPNISCDINFFGLKGFYQNQQSENPTFYYDPDYFSTRLLWDKYNDHFNGSIDPGILFLQLAVTCDEDSFCFPEFLGLLYHGRFGYNFPTSKYLSTYIGHSIHSFLFLETKWIRQELEIGLEVSAIKSIFFAVYLNKDYFVRSDINLGIKMGISFYQDTK